MADGSGPPLPPPSRPDWSGEEEDGDSGRGVLPLHPPGEVGTARAAAAAGGGETRTPLNPVADALSLFHLTPNAITEVE